jgi:predicted cupin superfamily sugar epimerase
MFGAGFSSYYQAFAPWPNGDILQDPGTMASLPAGTTLTAGWLPFNAVISDTWFPTMQNPTNTSTLMTCGMAGSLSAGAGLGAGTGQSFVLTIGTNTPGVASPYATMRLSFFIWNPDGQWFGTGPTSIRLITTNSDSGLISDPIGLWGQGLMFFDITNYQAGDQIEIWINNTNAGSFIQGIAFDVVNHTNTAMVSYAGTDFEYPTNDLQFWRNPAVPKPLDIDGDNIWGTAGYVMFGTGLSEQQFSFPYGDILQTDGTLANLPVGMGLKIGANPPNKVISDTWFPSIQDPSNTNNLITTGVAVNNFTGTGQAYVLTMGSNTPGVGNSSAKMRVGLVLWNPVGQWWGAGPTSIQLQTPTGSSTGYVPTYLGSFALEMMCFDITNYSSGDQIQIWLNGATTNSAIMGMTFDVQTQVAPTSLQPLSITNSSGSFKVTWPAPTFGTAVLQTATNVAGPYSTVIGATSPYTIPMTNKAAFFRTTWTNP